MSDAVLRIGAAVDKQAIEDGMAAGQDAVQAATSGMALSFDQLQGIATAASAKIGQSVRDAAVTIGDASVQAAEALKRQKAAMTEQSAAAALLKDRNTDAAVSTRLFAAAQEKAWQTTMELKAAQAQLAAVRVGAPVVANQLVQRAAATFATSPGASDELLLRQAAAERELTAARAAKAEITAAVASSDLDEEARNQALAESIARVTAAEQAEAEVKSALAQRSALATQAIRAEAEAAQAQAEQQAAAQRVLAVAGTDAGDELQLRLTVATRELTAAKGELAEVTRAVTLANLDQETADRAVAAVSERVAAAEQAQAAAKTALKDRAEAAAAALRKEAEATRLAAQQQAANAEVQARAALASKEASAEAQKLAGLTLQQTALEKELKDTREMLSRSTADLATQSAVLAPLEERQRALTLEVADAQKELAKALKRAAEESELSSNVFIASFQRIALAARESMGEVRERIYEAAGSMKMSEGFSFGSLGGLGELLGIGIAVDMTGEFLDKIAEVNVELGHLHGETGITASALSGLQLIVKEMGGNWEAVTTGLVRMQRAQVLALQGHKEQANAFHDIGISVEELRQKDPDALLQRIATALSETGNQQAKTLAATQLFGRAGAALIPILGEQGEQLTANIAAHAKLTGVTNESVAASERWIKNMADLTTKLHAFGNFAIENMHYVVGAFDAVGAAVVTVFEAVAAAVVSVFEGISAALVAAGRATWAFGKLLGDVVTGNFAALPQDARNMSAVVRDTWSAAAKEIGANWKAAGAEINNASAQVAKDFRKPEAAEGEKRADGGIPDPLEGGGGGGGASKADEQRLRRFEQALNEEKLLHSVSVKEEYDFWQAKLAEFARGSAQYGTVLNKLATLAEEGARKLHEAIAKLKEKPQKDAALDESFRKEFERTSAELDIWMEHTREDLTRTGERWHGYWRAVAEGDRQAAAANAALQEQALEAQRAAGGISELGYAQQLQAIHARQAKDELAALNRELAALQLLAAKSAHDPITGNLLDPRLAEQIKQLENQIAQLKAKMVQQGHGDAGAVNNAIAKPYLAAFHAIDQGWQKVQRDLLMGTGNIKRDFAQMGAELVVQMAQNLEKMLAQWAAYEIRTVLVHKLGNALKLADTATTAAVSNTITQQSALKEIYIDAKAAAAKAYKATVGIPVVGPILAPIAAGVSFAAVMSLAAFEKGGVVDGPQGMAVPILAHGGERVLTAAQTSNFERLVNHNTSTSSTRTNNVRANVNQTIHTPRPAGPRETVAGFKQAVRRGGLSLAR